MLMSKLEWDQSRLRHATIQTCKVPKGQTHLNLSILSSLVLKAMSPQTDLFSYTSSEIPELIFWWGKAQVFKLFSFLLAFCHQDIFPTRLLWSTTEFQYHIDWVPTSHCWVFPLWSFFGCLNPATDFNNYPVRSAYPMCYFFTNTDEWKSDVHTQVWVRKDILSLYWFIASISLISKSHNMKKNFCDTCE